MYGDHRPRGYVLRAEEDRYTPTAALRRAAALHHEHQADCVVIKANGGEYMPALLTEVDPTVQWRIVHATRNKRARRGPGRDAVRAGAHRPRGPAAHLCGLGKSR